MATHLPTYLTLAEAAARYALPPDTLNTALNHGTLKAVQMPSGEVLVAIEDVQVLAARLEPAPVNPELVGQPIRAAEAAEKYHVTDVNLSRWADAGYIRILERAPKLLVLDESDVQRAAELFHRARLVTGSYVRAGWVLKRALASSPAA